MRLVEIKMKIAIIQGSSQIDKNELLFIETKQAVSKYNYDVYNFGVTLEEPNFSYVQISLIVALLLNSKAVDFIITGCSSGVGMSIACNALPDVVCGYVPTPSDAFLFGRINSGNCVSLPLGLNFGWAGELNLRYTLEKLFEEPFNTGYPKESANRKKEDTNLLKKIKAVSHHDIISILNQLDTNIINPIIEKNDLISFICDNGTNTEITNYLIKQKNLCD